MTAQPLFFSALALAGLSLCGCQSWQGTNFPMQNATRVPPPGTGTYQLPSGYYNNSSNTSALVPASSLMQAAAGSNSPGTNSPGTSPATNFAPVSAVTAGYSTSPTSLPMGSTASSPASAVVPASATGLATGAAYPSTTPQFTQASPMTSGGSSASISDDNAPYNSAPNDSALSVEAPSLQWQQFGEH